MRSEFLIRTSTSTFGVSWLYKLSYGKFQFFSSALSFEKLLTALEPSEIVTFNRLTDMICQGPGTIIDNKEDFLNVMCDSIPTDGIYFLSMEDRPDMDA